jgi:dienelactone hydrolase
MSDITIVLSKHEVVLDRMFAEDTWELAFGDNAWENDYTDADVLHKLKEFSHKAHAWDTMWEEHQPNDEDEDTQADYDLREKMETYLGSCTHE